MPPVFKSTVKILAMAIGGVIALAVVALFAITTLINPSHYKEQIESLAQQQGYPIRIDGEMGWRVFPRLGLTLGQSTLLTDAPQPAELVSVQQVQISVEVLPLLSKRVVVDQILLDGLTANLVVDRNGQPNWAHLLNNTSANDSTKESSTKETPTSSTANQHPLHLVADGIQLRNAHLRYRDQSKQTDLRLGPIHGHIHNLNLRGQTFPVALTWTSQLAMGSLAPNLPTLHTAGEFSANLKLNTDLSQLHMQQGQLAASLGDGARSTPIKRSFNADIEGLQQQPSIALDLALASTDLKAIANQILPDGLITHAPQALTQVAVTLSARGGADDLTVDPINLQIDDTQVQGSLSLRQQNTLQLRLTGDRINLDDYLPNSQSANDANKTPIVDQQLSHKDSNQDKHANSPADKDHPLAQLNHYQANVDIRFDQITALGLPLRQPRVQAQLANGVLTLTPAAFELQGKTIELSGQLNTQGEIQGKLKLPALNLRSLLTQLDIPLPATADPDTLQALGLNLAFTGKPSDIVTNQIDLTLDQTTFTGSARLANFNHLTLKLDGTDLDMDRYLAPPTADQAGEQPDSQTGTKTETKTRTSAAEQPLDFTPLLHYQVNAELTLEQLKANNLALSNITLAAHNKAGLAKLNQLSADFYQGKLTANGQLDARATTAKLTLKARGDKVAVNPLLQALEAQPNKPGHSNRFVLAGLANGELTLNTQGKTTSALIDNSDASITAHTQQLQLAPINLQQMICQGVTLIQGEQLTDIDWPALTQMHDLNAKIHYRNQVASIQTLSAGVEQFTLQAKGRVDIGRQQLDVRLPVGFSQALSKQPGCPETSAWVVGKILPLVRCKGSLLEPAKACGLDNRAIRNAVKDYAEASAQEKIDAEKKRAQRRLDEKKDRLKDKIDEQLGEGASELLNSLFKQPKSKDKTKDDTKEE